MASNLGCIGLQPESDDALLAVLNSVETELRKMAVTDDGTELLQWTDESGARLTLAVRGEDIVDLVPSFAGATGVALAGLARQGEYVAADVLDDAGELATRLLCELEQSHVLTDDGPSGAAALTAFGVDVTIHADEAAFAASDDSLLTPGDVQERPAELPAGAPWPPRLAPESFYSFGVFAEDTPDAEPYARMSARVVDAQTRTNSRTQQQFHAVQVTCTGMDLVLCLAASDHPAPPEPGNIVSGITYLSASVPSLWPSAKARRESRP